MRGAWLESYGGPHRVAVRDDVPVPPPAAGEVLVRVRAAAVNYPDLLVMNNGYQLSAELPFTPGSEFAGEVLVTGAGVSEFAVGDRVAGSAFVGAFAEQVIAPVGRLRPMPSGLDWVHAAAYGAIATTAYHSLVTVGGVAKGDVVVVLGAAGGVGSACVGMARLLGAEPIGVVSSPEKAAFARAQGATHVVDYRATDLREALRALAADGTALVLDPVGGDGTIPALRSLRQGGRFVVIGFASGDVPCVPLNLVLVKGLQIVAVDVRRLREQHPEVIAAGNAEIAELIRRGWRPAVDTTFPLERVTEALERVSTAQAMGKVVVTID